MPFIIGTAGHIDHGKTSLIKALTGFDTDRLKEEKERGISIDLGFAHIELPDGTSAGIVDVPGHERFIRLPEPARQSGEDRTYSIAFTILDRPPLPEDPSLWPEPDAIPRAVGQVDVADVPEAREYQVLLTGTDGETLGPARELFEGVAQEVVESSKAEDHPLIYSSAKELAPMLFAWHFPKKMPVYRQSLFQVAEMRLCGPESTALRLAWRPALALCRRQSRRGRAGPWRPPSTQRTGMHRLLPKHLRTRLGTRNETARPTA